MREIITLQLGQLSNYTATHFWNTQESYFTYAVDEQSPVDHNVHWRAGLGADGSETFLPRTVIYDLKGGFGSLRKINALYEPESEATPQALWSGPSVVHKQQSLEVNAYQQSLDSGSQPPQLTTSTVRYWSDFSRVFFHPRSLVQLYDFELNSTTMPFERFGMGSELFSVLDREHELVDRDWRPFAEEADQMQGIQVFTSIDDAWGGFASSYIEALRDEYPKTCIWVWGLQSPMLDISRSKRQLRLANTAHSIDELCAQASTLVPLALPETDLPASISMETRSQWHVSAVMAAAIETATLPSRLTQESAGRPASLDYLAECLNPAGNQPLVSMQMALAPATDTPDDSRIDVDFFQIGRGGYDRQRDRESRIFGQVLSCRALGPKDDDEHQDLSGHRGRQVIGNPVIRKYQSSLRFPLLDSYPQIYTRAADQQEIAVQTNLSSNTSMAPCIKALRVEATRLVGVEEREALSHGLAELGEAYREDWSSGSDDDDDDV
ncbi:tubulin domain-containing protein [Dactylonectria macrodidyma]|uniref:Tubulin domain-containing protein n=1 Tax=Dactylonectria macrodidyma TaxID=307937 RepID=A0A9P9IQP4_9HYPO|nr:tubulin domain-containing protein [Dactylonectria macrodidyma]